MWKTITILSQNFQSSRSSLFLPRLFVIKKALVMGISKKRTFIHITGATICLWVAKLSILCSINLFYLIIRCNNHIFLYSSHFLQVKWSKLSYKLIQIKFKCYLITSFKLYVNECVCSISARNKNEKNNKEQWMYTVTASAYFIQFLMRTMVRPILVENISTVNAGNSINLESAISCQSGLSQPHPEILILRNWANIRNQILKSRKMKTNWKNRLLCTFCS